MKPLLLSAALAAATSLSSLSAEAADYRRIVSIGGDVTEIVFALGEGDRLVARDSTSTFPPEAKRLPDAGYMRALSAEGVLGTRPDAVLLSEGAGPPEQLQALKASGIPVETVPEGHDAEAIQRKIEAVGRALGKEQAAAALADKVAADLEAATKEASRPAADRKRVLFILSLSDGKIIAAGDGSSADAMLTLAGADNAVSGFKGYKALAPEAISRARPDAILMMERSSHAAAADDLRANPALADTPAVRSGAIIRMDGLTLLGFGPRTAQAIRELSAALYGERS